MARDFFPRPEAEIVQWTANFSQHINAAPSDFGISPARTSAYALLQQAFADAYFTFQSPGTDSTTARSAKDSARIALEKATRPIVRIVKVWPTVSDAMLVAAGLRPRAPRRRHVAPPDHAPIVRIGKVVGKTVHVVLLDATATRRGKPRDVTGATLFSYVGNDPPTSLRQWQFKDNITRATAQVRFDANLPAGTTVWLTARWTTRRNEHGPAAAPVYTTLTHGVAKAASGMKLAA